jgi:hypothetical protein
MARARLGLQKAINEILERHGSRGKRLSLRQAERLTGLSPATVGELAKGNARTPETVRRFAQGLGESAERLLLLAGFVEAVDPASNLPVPPPGRSALSGMEGESVEIGMWLERFSRALNALPPGRARDLYLTRLRCDTELLESLLTHRSDTVPADAGTTPTEDQAVGAIGANAIEGETEPI